MAGIPSEEFPSSEGPMPRIEELRQKLAAAERATGLSGEHGASFDLGIAAIDAALGGGLGGGALHEIAAVRESEASAATGFALAVTARFTGRSRRNDPGRAQGRLSTGGRAVLWIAEDLLIRRKRRPLWAWSRRSRHCSRAADHGRRRAHPRCAVGDGGGAALSCRRRGDRRDGHPRPRSSGDAAPFARSRSRRHARSSPARGAGRRAFRRCNAMDRRRSAVLGASPLGKVSRHRPAAPGRASRAQPPWSSRSMDRGVEQCGAAFRARNAF